ncbi:MAG: deoxyguanosinetriphosphate triphosphohydrolase [bacterium]|nr:deoxyguanosinetriphosphate triphosphohydrolase [bacterium]
MPTDAQQAFAPLVVHAVDSHGRRHVEPEIAGDIEPTAPPRDAFELDRQRVFSSASFRRLKYKTQVFVTTEHDHFRTRLTHTLEVAQVARRLARALGVNEVLAEVIALAHDLGHAPFGHAGEVTLRRMMQGHGGFEHNLQSLRVVDYLEHPYPPFRGLNLTYETREGLAKHATPYDQPDAGASGDPALAELNASGRWPTIEGQIACVADTIAYDTHDLEDAIGATLLTESKLDGVELWHQAAAPVRAAYPDAALPAVRRPILDRLADLLTADVVEASTLRAKTSPAADVDGVRRAPQTIVGFSAPMQTRVEALQAFLKKEVYRHERLMRMDEQAPRFLERLFEAYLNSPDRLPPRFAGRVAEQGVHRVVCDYLAGMTDRFCEEDYKRLFQS